MHFEEIVLGQIAMVKVTTKVQWNSLTKQSQT
jgi:hypothetical protein